MKKNAIKRVLKQNAGFTLLELLFALSIIIMVMSMNIQSQVRQSKIDKAKMLGRYVQQYNQAVRSYIVENGTAAIGTYTGVNWLKDAGTCPGGTAPIRYLPCGFQYPLPYNVTLNTTIANVGGTVVGTTTFTPIIMNGVTRKDLAGAAINVANAGNRINGAPVGTESYTFSTADGILAVTSNNPGIDPWLRLDGTNTMTGNLNMGNNNLVNANDVNANNDVNAGNNVTAAQNMTAGNTITATNDIFGRDVQSTGKGTWLSQGVQYKTIARSNDIIPKPVCVQPGSTPQIYGAPIMVSNDAVGDAIGAIQAWATDIGASWQVFIRILVASGWKSAPSNYRLIEVSTKCS